MINNISNKICPSNNNSEEQLNVNFFTHIEKEQVNSSNNQNPFDIHQSWINSKTNYVYQVKCSTVLKYINTNILKFQIIGAKKQNIIEWHRVINYAIQSQTAHVVEDAVNTNNGVLFFINTQTINRRSVIWLIIKNCLSSSREWYNLLEDMCFQIDHTIYLILMNFLVDYEIFANYHTEIVSY